MRASPEWRSHPRGGPEPVVSGPASGRLLQPFWLPASTGSVARPSHYKQRTNLVVFCFRAPDCAPCRALLIGLAESVTSYAEAEAVVLGVSSEPAGRLEKLAGDLRLPFALLSDPDGQIGASLQLNVPAVLITDRFAEIWAAWDGGTGHALRTTARIGKWLEFIELQCRECEAPEWPLTDAACPQARGNSQSA